MTEREKKHKEATDHRGHIRYTFIVLNNAVIGQDVRNKQAIESIMKDHKSR